MGCVLVPQQRQACCSHVGWEASVLWLGGCSSTPVPVSSGCPNRQLSSSLTARLFASYSLIEIRNVLFPLSKVVLRGLEPRWTESQTYFWACSRGPILRRRIFAYCRCHCVHGTFHVDGNLLCESTLQSGERICHSALDRVESHCWKVLGDGNRGQGLILGSRGMMSMQRGKQGPDLKAAN